ncbi:hypothetical protein, partial [Pseudooceanicola onchidii]|uniref:hypothetical protein n=1 Tax=Pseudooceanicola onchidii TaxID=2562279 RepID=UPI0019807212
SEPRSVVPSGVPLCASAPPVRGYLRMGAGVRKGFSAGTVIFFSKKWIAVYKQTLKAVFFLDVSVNQGSLGLSFA